MITIEPGLAVGFTYRLSSDGRWGNICNTVKGSPEKPEKQPG